MDARVVILTVSDFAEVDNPLPDFRREVMARLAGKPASFMLDSRSRIEEATAVVEAAKRADVVLMALAVQARSGAGHLAVPVAARAFVEQLPANVKTIAVSFGSPYVIRDLPRVQTCFCAYGIQPVMQSAVAQAMFGEAPVTGRLPVTIPGLHQRGEGIQRAMNGER